MFELDRAAAKISAVTKRRRKARDDRVAARRHCQSDLAEHVAERLDTADARASTCAAKKEGTLDLPDNNLCELRFPHMGPLSGTMRAKAGSPSSSSAPPAIATCDHAGAHLEAVDQTCWRAGASGTGS